MKTLSEDEILRAETRLYEARSLRKSGKTRKAMQICMDLVRRHPDFVGAAYDVALMHIERGDYRSALGFIHMAAINCPGDYRIMTNLSAVYFQLGFDDFAEDAARSAIQLNHENPEIHFNLGNILFRRKDYTGAAKQFEEAIRLNAAPRVAAINLGQCYEQLGRLKDAVEIYLKAMKMGGDASDALNALSDLPIAPAGIDVLAELEKSMKCGKQRTRDAVTSSEFVYARALDKAGRYADAWAAIVEANKKVLASGACNRQRERQQEQDTLRWAKSCPAVIAPPPDPGKPFARPVFILGASRSGKSTAERLLGTFPGVKCGYENQLVRESVRASNQIAGRLGLEVFQELPEQLYPTFTRNFLERLSRVAGGASACTTTTPGQIHNVPRLLATIPGVRIIFVKRDVLDTALRIIFGKYKFGNDYSYAVSTAFDHIAWYHSLIDLFVEKYPANTLLIRYEDLVRDTGNVADRLARFCKLPNRPDALLPIGDDIGCAAPYRDLLLQCASAQAGSGL